VVQTRDERINLFLQQQYEKSGWVSKIIQNGANWGFKLSEFYMVPQALGDEGKTLQQILGKKTADKLSEAWHFLPQGPGLQLASLGDFDVKRADSLKAATDILSSYENNLSGDANPDSAKGVRAILDRTMEALRLQAAGDPKAAETISKLVGQLIASEQFNGDEVKAMNDYVRNNDDPSGTMAGRPLLASDFEQLYAGRIPSWLDIDRGEHVKQMAEGFLKNRDQAVQAARRIALLYLTRSGDGKLPESIGTANVIYPWSVRLRDGGYRPPEDVLNKQTVSIDTNSLVTRLRDSLGYGPAGNDGAQTASRNMAVGDVLVRVNAITHQQYGAILEDVLRNPQSSKQDKIQALLGGQGIDFATLTAGVRAYESVNREADGSATSVSSKDLLSTLEAVASNPKENQEVRAVAALLQFGLQPENVAALPDLIAFAHKQADNTGNIPDGNLSPAVLSYFLDRAINPPPGTVVDDSELTTRLSAAKALELLADQDHPNVALTAATAFTRVAMVATTSPQIQASAFQQLA